MKLLLVKCSNACLRLFVHDLPMLVLKSIIIQISTFIGERERANLVVQLARDFHIYVCMGRHNLAPCINCVLAYGTREAAEIDRALRANVKLEPVSSENAHPQN